MGTHTHTQTHTHKTPHKLRHPPHTQTEHKHIRTHRRKHMYTAHKQTPIHTQRQTHPHTGTDSQTQSHTWHVYMNVFVCVCAYIYRVVQKQEPRGARRSPGYRSQYTSCNFPVH